MIRQNLIGRLFDSLEIELKSKFLKSTNMYMSTQHKIQAFISLFFHIFILLILEEWYKKESKNDAL